MLTRKLFNLKNAFKMKKDFFDSLREASCFKGNVQ